MIWCRISHELTCWYHDLDIMTTCWMLMSTLNLYKLVPYVTNIFYRHKIIQNVFILYVEFTEQESLYSMKVFSQTSPTFKFWKLALFNLNFLKLRGTMHCPTYQTYFHLDFCCKRKSRFHKCWKYTWSSCKKSNFRSSGFQIRFKKVSQRKVYRLLKINVLLKAKDHSWH